MIISVIHGWGLSDAFREEIRQNLMLISHGSPIFELEYRRFLLFKIIVISRMEIEI